MAAIQAAFGDAVLTFMWVFVSSMFGLFTNLVVTALGLQTLVWAPLVITTFIVFTFVFLFNLIGEALGGASFNPTGTASFYAAGVGGDTLFSMALKFPAQAAGAVGGALAIMEVMPVQYKHMLGGPTLQRPSKPSAADIVSCRCDHNIGGCRLCLHRSFHESCQCEYPIFASQFRSHLFLFEDMWSAYEPFKLCKML
ncbi:AQUAPORIN SIP1-1 [Salix purpurea]|uniref:AQUAPORIN SIP1-1 n=1 Tax=Salix purpurea TaxID=77065 RepID=A0A9Q0V9L2_SALPP|nr:AQUAPORIN SIP1-1 [Salix purpurea]